ncbi:hypothetical protein B0H13DRAFT_2021114 [Mycena leptocephala]|nr:hypothetical protein B0H13DRAFT_2021114 [Mycena leptocephala]
MNPHPQTSKPSSNNTSRGIETALYRRFVLLRPNSNVEEEEAANVYELVDALRRLSPRVRISSSPKPNRHTESHSHSHSELVLTLKYLPSPAHALAAPNLVTVIGEAFNAAAAGASAGPVREGSGVKFSSVCFLGGSMGAFNLTSLDFNSLPLNNNSGL